MATSNSNRRHSECQEELEEMLRGAARDSNTNEVIRLLNAGVNVDATDEDGYTALIMASQYGRVECVKVLLDRGAQANFLAKVGHTALIMASQYGHVECVKVLLDRGAQANLQDKELEKKLRDAARGGNTDEVILLLDAGVNVDATDKDGITALIWASAYGHVECVKVLLDGGAQANLQNKNGHTALMWASQYGHVECVKVLLDRGAQANLQTKGGETALMAASQGGHVELVKVLLDRGAQANLQAKEELKEAIRNGNVEEVMRLVQLDKSTAEDPEGKLIEAARQGRTEEVIALLDAGVNVNASDKDGSIALIKASTYGHVECVKVLLSRGAQANLQNKGGMTALHYAAIFNKVDTLKALLAAPGIDVNIQDSSDRIPLKYATKYDVLAMLQKYTTSCEDYPIHTFGKIILCGDTGSGKSTLAQAIKYCSQLTFDKGIPPGATLPGPVKLLTAGIVPHLIKNQEMNMMLYDLAGHREYYSSHCAVLEAISLSPSTFLMLLNLLLDLKEISAQMYYWFAMIGDVCHKCPQQSSVIVVGTHADGIADREQLEFLCGEIKKLASGILKHTFVGVIALNATALHGEEMKSFMSSLRLTNDSVIAKHPAISLNSHMMYAFLNDRVPPHQDAISMPQLVTLLGQEEPKFLPTEASEITPLLKTLSDKGFIVFLDGDEPNSWIVIHPEALLEKVNGVLFAPKKFKEHLPIASNTGVISVPLLKLHFPEDTVMIVEFMKSYELCVPITLTNVDTNMTPAGSPNTPSTDQLGPLLFFPACVSVEMPSSVTIPQRGFGWLICTGDINQFFSPRCVHALSTRLAHGWALPKVEPSLIAGQTMYNRKCTVWSRGISWMSEEGVTTVVEIKDNSRCLSCTSDESSPKYMSSVMKVIKEACEEFCPSVKLLELITCPPEATSDLTATTVELHLLKKIIQSKRNTLSDTGGEKRVTVSEWMKVEPQLLDLIGMEQNEGGGQLQVNGRSGAGDDDYFSAVSKDPLGEDDLIDVMEEVMDMASKWRPLGLALRLKPAQLDTIFSKNHTDPTECLRDMLLSWLQQRYDTTKFGQPSWRLLCQAIHKPAGGNNPGLARKIAGEKP